MKKTVIVLILISLLSCEKKVVKKSKFASFEKVFSEVDSLLNVDNGKFWKYSLNGKILLVDPQTRAFVANSNNTKKSFREEGKVFLDTLPQNLVLANTAITWDDERWTMVMQPLPEIKTVRNGLIVHELFHQFQPKLGFDNLQEYDNSHLDSYEGRVLLKLELEALKQAINTNTKTLKNTHLKNALFFRMKRQVTNTIKIAENALELNEGLAEYTGLMLSGKTFEEKKEYLKSSLGFFYNNPTFVRSFAYQTIPFYGFLLSQDQKYWHQNINKQSNLTDYFQGAFGLKLTEDETLYIDLAKKHNYNYLAIEKEESKREEERLIKTANFKKKFIESPTLKLNFKNRNISFDPTNMSPLENYGTVYPTMRATDDWGILTVEKGALIDINWGFVIVSKPTEITDSIIKGDGWVLELKKEWEIKKIADNFILIKNQFKNEK